MIRRVRSVMLTTGSITFLTFACSDGVIEGQPPQSAPLDPPLNAAGMPSAPRAGSASVGGAAGSPTQPALGGNATVGGSTPKGDGGSQTGGGGSGPTAGAGGSASQAGAGGAGVAGMAGMAGMPACDDAEDIRCGNSCVDPRSSDDHCGACNQACPSDQECSDSKCQCTDERTLCGSTCVDTDSDEQNCGSCGSKCATGASCSDGECSGGDPGGVVTSCSSISDFGVVSSTIVVKKGQVYDGRCKRYRADPDELGDGSQEEGQEPVFLLEDGARLINVVLGAPAADGIHTEGDVTLENITWEDVGEDALTIKESGTVVLNGGSATKADDKIFQLNAASTFRLSNFKASDAGKLIRQVGGSTFKVSVFIDRCDISGMDESIFRTDSSTSTVSMTNTRYHDVGTLFIGVSSGNISQSNNTKY